MRDAIGIEKKPEVAPAVADLTQVTRAPTMAEIQSTPKSKEPDITKGMIRTPEMLFPGP